MRRLPCSPPALLAAAAGIVLCARNAAACPDCDTARLVRASLFEAGFWTRLGLLWLPLLVLVVISVLLYRIQGPRPRATVIGDPRP